MSTDQNRAGTRIARWTLRRRWLVIAASVAGVGAAAAGMGRLRFSDDYRAFFGRTNPQLEAYEGMQKVYTRADNILFVVEPRGGGGVVTREGLLAIESLVAGAWQLPYARRVDALTNFQHTRANGDELTVADLVPDAAAMGEAELRRVRAVSLAEPLLRDRLIAGDGGVAGVNVALQFPGVSADESAESVFAARALSSRIEAEHPFVRVRITGVAPLNHAFTEASENDMKTLIPLMLAGIAVLTALLLRSVLATGAVMLVLLMSAGAAMGLAGWAGMAITPPSSIAPTMILTIAIADGIHILVAMFGGMRGGLDRRSALVESLRVNLQPVFLTSLTTVIGFLSLNFSDAPPFRDLGNITALGVTAAFFLSLFFLPALISVLPVRAPSLRDRRRDWTEKLADFVVLRRRPLLWGSSVVVLAAAVFVPRNELNDQFVRYFGERIPFRQATEFTMSHLTGIYQIEYSLGSGEDGGIVRPEYLAKVGEFGDWWRSQPDVVQVQSLVPTMKRINRSMHGDDAAFYRLPETRELAAQYLLLYELSLPYGLDLTDQIDVAQSATRMTVTLADVSAREMRDLAAAGESWLRSNAPASMFSHAAGPSLMFANISGHNIRSMLVGTAVAFLLVSLTLVFALGSVRYGLLSLIPNIAPAVIAFGLWGLFVGQVNVGLSIVTAMTFGIVVDDSIHFLSKYLRARREHGMSPADAVRYVFRIAGSALLATSVILAGGFMILAASAFDLNGSMGRLTAITIIIALAADFLMLPPLLLLAGRREAARVAPLEDTGRAASGQALAAAS